MMQKYLPGGLLIANISFSGVTSFWRVHFSVLDYYWLAASIGSQTSDLLLNGCSGEHGDQVPLLYTPSPQTNV